MMTKPSYLKLARWSSVNSGWDDMVQVLLRLQTLAPV